MTKEQAIITAAKWWSNKLRQKPRHDNGDRGLASLFACALADSAMTEITEEQLTKFEEALIENLSLTLSYDKNVNLNSDYSPDAKLKSAADLAGINTSNFPFKTSLWIQKE